MSSTITLDVEDLVNMVADMTTEIATAILVKAGLLTSQKPKATAPAKRSAKPKAAPKPRSQSKASRSTKPVSVAQHAKGSVIEVVFGIRADGSLTEAQQSRARSFFAGHDIKFGPQAITMLCIVQGIQSLNHQLRSENESTVRYWAVWNGPKGVGRLTDKQARELLRSSR